MGGMTLAHRFAWELTYGLIPDSLCCLHKCDNPPCVNPSHLYLGSYADNSDDMIKRNRQRHPAGILNGNSKLKDADVRRIRFLLEQGLTHDSIAKKNNIGRSCVSKIKNRVIWSHLE